MKAPAFGPAFLFAVASALNRWDVVITRPFLATLLSEGILAVAAAIHSDRRLFDLGANVTAVSLSRQDTNARRRLPMLAASALIGLGLALGPAPAQAQTVVPSDQLMAPGPLPDLALGSASAPVTIVEYASMTCSHCAAFHEETWPKLKAKYVDSGKVRFILREFPLDPLAAAGSMLARCAGPDRRNAIVDLLYTQQKNWAFVDKPLDALAGLVKQAGVSQADFNSCLKDQALLSQVYQTREDASKKFKVNSTPTFFVNGSELNGELPIEEFDKVLGPMLK
jgi:protein-disulfide isomerase